MCPASCQPDAETLRALPSVFGMEDQAALRNGPRWKDDDDMEGFFSRKWLKLPEHQFDMNTLHPPLPPFLGSMYWTAASPLPEDKKCMNSPRKSRQEDFLPLITPSTVASSPSPCTRFGIQESLSQLVDKRAHKLLLSLNSTASSDCSETSGSSAGIDNEYPATMNTHKRNIDTSHEILDYSALDDSYNVLHTSMDERQRSPQTPRRLFEDEGDDVMRMTPRKMEQLEESMEYATPERPLHVNLAASNISGHHLTSQNESRAECERRNEGVTVINDDLERHKKSPYASPSVSTFVGIWGRRRERHVSTLPSHVQGKPIRLRVTEKDTGRGGSFNDEADFFSYDPYFASGKYLITTIDGRPYGNGLFMKLGSQFMTLEDIQGNVLAVIKSRYTCNPSHVVYAPKPRFLGQAPSGHRLSLNSETSVVDGNASIGESAELYPWALIQKEGRTMGDDVTVHLVDEASTGKLGRTRSGSSASLFNSNPTFRGKHGFDHELHTHTVVTRSVLSDGKGKSLEEVPCCVIVRDLSNIDVVGITIAPGIDPLLMICYLASHSKMDVEPIMGGC